MEVLCTVPDNTDAQQILQFQKENTMHFETRDSEYSTNINRQLRECATHAAKLQKSIKKQKQKTPPKHIMFLISLFKKQSMEIPVDILALKAQFVWPVHCYSFAAQYIQQAFDEVR